MHVDPSRLVRVRQVHGRSAAIAEDAGDSQAQADIIVSGDPTLALAVQTADCIPLLLADRRTGVVAAAHAGWRGLAARAPAAAVATLAREFGSRSADLIAAIGPAIGACCYEVGADVRERFAAAGCSGDQLARWFLTVPPRSVRNASIPEARGPRAPDRWFFEVWATAREQLMEAGVRDDQIFVAGLCTASHPDVFCSYRRDGPSAGRTAGAIRSARLRP